MNSLVNSRRRGVSAVAQPAGRSVASSRSAFAVAAIACGIAHSAFAAETTTTVWTLTGTGGVDAQGASNTFPSGLGVTVNLGGPPIFQAQGVGQSLDDTNGTTAMFAPPTNMPVAGAGALGIQTNLSSVQPPGQPGVCGIANAAQGGTSGPAAR